MNRILASVSALLSTLITAALLVATPAGASPAGAGTLDPSFGERGVALDRFPDDQDLSLGSDQLLQSDGRTVLLGDARHGFGLKSGLVRYLPDGSLDQSFGHEGMAVTAFGKRVSIEGAGVERSADGGYLVAATRNTGTTEEPAYTVVTYRYSPTGKLDTTYGAKGLAVLDLGTPAIARSTTTDKDGALLIAVSMAAGQGETGGIVRVAPNGSLDRLYGDHGIAPMPGSDATRISQVAVDSAGRALLAGTTFRAEPGTEATRQVVARFQADGQVDRSFGTDGRAMTEVADINAGAALVIDCADRPVVAGYAIADETAKADFSLVRYTENGERDRDFGDAGISTFPVSQDDDTPAALVTDDQGRILVAGTRWTETPESQLQRPATADGLTASGSRPQAQERSGFELARVSPSGELDQSFGQGGSTVSPLQAGAAAFSIATSPRHGIQIVGFSFTQDFVYSLTTARYLS